MTTTTEIASLANLLDFTDYAGEYLADYDMDAIRSDVIDAVQKLLPEGATVLSNGDVIAECDMQRNLAGDWSGVPHTDDGDIDWAAIVKGIDLAPIFDRHDVTTRISETFGELGETVYQGRDQDGNLIAAWGPDTRDENGHPLSLDDLSDENWIATRWEGEGDDAYAVATECGTKTEIEELGRKWMK